MRPFVTVTALLLGVAAAAPYPQSGADGTVSHCQKHPEDPSCQAPPSNDGTTRCANNPNCSTPSEPDPTKGDGIYVDSSDKAVSFGNTHPRQVFEKLLQHCSTVGCSGDKVLTVDTTVPGGGGADLDKTVIRVSAEASFIPDGKATREALVEILSVIADKATQKTDTKYMNCGGGLSCEEASIEQYALSQTIHIVINEPNDRGHLNVYIEMGPENSGFCSTMLGAAGAVAGAISGLAAVPFNLAGLFCSL